MSQHDRSCKWPTGEPCRKFSTDGTRLGAVIAHTMGTDSEEAITEMGRRELEADLTGMDEEQADWESDESEDATLDNDRSDGAGDPSSDDGR